MNNDSFNQALRYRLLNILKEEPHLTQKAMAKLFNTQGYGREGKGIHQVFKVKDGGI